MAFSTIKKSIEYFNVNLYTGNGSSQSITGVGFQPDWVWLKERSSTSPHKLLDAVRGATKELESNSANAEATEAQSLTAFDSDGFSVGSNGAVNENSQTYVSWNWKAGTTSGLSGGTITPTGYSINTTAGFGIYAYTGTGSVGTIAHGLGAKPNFIIQKRLNSNAAFTVYHDKFASDPATDYLYLNTNAALNDYADHWNDTEPTSSVITLGTDTSVNGNGYPNIIYAFTEKKGFSKFGKYTGNGSTDGPFIYCGFKPAWVMTKKISGTADWLMRDHKRDFNGQWRDLYANNTNAETSPDSNTNSELYSNGLKLRMSHSNHNESGGTYIFMAFAKEPFVADETTNGVPATAR